MKPRRGARRRLDRPGRLLRDLAPDDAQQTRPTRSTRSPTTASRTCRARCRSPRPTRSRTRPSPTCWRSPSHGVEGAIARDPGLRLGVNVAGGAITNAAVAEGVGLPFTPVDEALGAGGIAAPDLTTDSRHEEEHDGDHHPDQVEIQNFIDGEERPPADGADRGGRQPRDRRADRDRAALRRAGRRRRRAGRRSGRSRSGPRRRRASARWRCCGSPTRSRSTADELSRARVAERRQADRGDARGDAVHGRQPALLRGRGPLPRGPRGRRVHDGATRR